MNRLRLHLAIMFVLAAAALIVVGVLTDAEPIAADNPVPCPTIVPVATATPDGGPTYTATLTHTPCFEKPDTPTPTGPLPDLVALGMSITLETGGDCDFTPKLGVRVHFSNSGAADAGTFSVHVNGVQQIVGAGLLQGQSGTLWFNGYISGKNTLFVDSFTQVAESNELNNELSQTPAVPTLPPTCTPASTPTITLTPPPAVGGVSSLAPVNGQSAAVAGSSEADTGFLWFAAMAGIIALACGVWYARRRLR